MKQRRPATSTQPFTDIPQLSDEDGLVVARGELVYAVLNLYPYNPGHLMVVPYRRVSELEDLTVAESAELMAFIQKAIRVIKNVSRPHGFNVGLNLGQSAGGSLAEHLHMHVVPRWGGDANFITIIGGAKVVPQLLRDTRQLLATEWAQAAVSRLLSADPRRHTPSSADPVARALLRAGFTPDSVTILGTAGAVLAALTLFPIGQLFAGAVVVSFFVLVDMLDGAMARERGGGTRFGAVLDATCDRISDGAVFCGLAVVGGIRPARHAVGGRDADLSGHVAGDLLHQGPGRGQRAARRRRHHRTTGTADHRAGRRGRLRFAVLARCRGAARGDVAAGGGQPGYLRAAVARRADLARRDGPLPTAAARDAAERRANRDRPGWPAERGWHGGSRWAAEVTDWGYAAGWLVVRRCRSSPRATSSTPEPATRPATAGPTNCARTWPASSGWRRARCPDA